MTHTLDRETIEYIHANTVKVLHRVLRVKRGYGVDFDIFLSMLQQATEEEGLMPLASVEHDNYVALVRDLSGVICGAFVAV